MNTPEKFSLLRLPAWSSLTRRLERAIARDAALTASRDVLLRPLQLLELMAADTPGALGDDVLTADRLRMLLHLASPFAGLVEEARDLDRPKTKASAKSAAPVAPVAYEPGLLDHGALAIVALAAIRVAPPEQGRLFLQTVHGLALSATPAEALGRLDPVLPDGDGLAVILNTLYLLDAVGAALKRPFLRPFSGDPVERARWSCLSRLLDHELFSSVIENATRWDGATSTGIQRFSPDHAWPGESIEIHGDFSHLGKGAQLPKHLSLVFASAHRAPLIAARVQWKTGPEGRSLSAEVPVGATPGWVGFSDEKRIEAANTYRLELAQALAREFDGQPCLAATRIPSERISRIGVTDPAQPGRLIAVPSRTASNRFSGGAPRLLFAEVDPENVVPGGEVTLRWESMGADEIRLEPSDRALPSSGSLVIAAPPDDGPLGFTLTPVRQRNGKMASGGAVRLQTNVRAPARIRSVQVSQQGRSTPLLLGLPLQVDVWLDPPTSPARGQLLLDDPRGAGNTPPQVGVATAGGLLRFVIPASAVRDALTFSVVVTESGASMPTDRCSQGPLCIRPSQALTLVLIRPEVAEPATPALTLEAAASALIQVSRELGIQLTIRHLPWVDDALAVLPEPIASAEDARVPLLLEQLARRAMLTPGLEGAVWLMLLPEAEPEPEGGSTGVILLRQRGSRRFASASAPSRQGIATFLPATAARAVAIADRAGLVALLADVVQRPQAEPSTAAGATTRLRILGSMHADLELDVESIEEEARAVGPGAPLVSELTAVALDALGRERLSQPVRCMRATRPALLGVLLPISRQVTCVELRDGCAVVRRFARTVGSGEFGEVELQEDARLRWNYNHSRGARPALTIALTAAEVTTAVLRLDPCDHSPRLPLWRFRCAEVLRVTASDGWNTVQRCLDRPFENPGAVVIRDLGDGRFWADVPEGSAFHWTLDGQPKAGSERVLPLSPGETGLLRLIAQLPGIPNPIVDVRLVAEA